METIKKFKKAGEPTECTPIDFVSTIREQLPIMQLDTVENAQIRFTNHFEEYDRYEYCVYDEDRLVAIMVVVQDIDVLSGKNILQSLHTASIKSNALKGAYHWMFNIARRMGLEYVVISRLSKGGFKTEAKLKKISKLA